MDTSNILNGLENKQMRAARKSKEKESSPEELQRKTKAALYLRVSSDMQRENFSISAQKEECLRYINEHGYTVAEKNIYIDEAYTAKNENRPAFQQLLVDAHAGEFSLIVAHKMDRLQRNLRLMLAMTEELKKINVTLYCVHQHMEVTDDLICKILAAISEDYLKNLADEVAKGKRQSCREGIFIGSTPPFGYKLLKPGFPGNEHGKHRKLVPDEKEAPAIKKCFEMYATNKYSFQDLADYLNVAGFTPRRNSEKRKSVFGKETIRSMMDNPVYVGILVYKSKNCELGYETYLAQHEPIIDPDVFSKVSAVRESRIINHNHNKADGISLKARFLVQNLICCAECGRRLRVQSGKKTFRYKDYSEERGLECKYSGEYADAHIIDKQVRDFVSVIDIPHSWSDLIEKKAEGQDYVSEIQSKIKIIQDRIKRRTNAYTVSGTYSFDDFQKEHNADLAEIEQLNEMLPKSSDMLNAQITITTSLINLFKRATASEQYDIVHYLFQNLYFDFVKFRLCAFEPRPEFEFLFSAFADKNGWHKKGNQYLIQSGVLYE